MADASAAGEGLQPNPSNCTAFVPNPFRREKCRDCGHPWHFHAGAISEALVREFQEDREGRQRQQVSRLQAAAKAKAEAKARARREAQAQRAVEDTWLFEGQADAADSADEDGFQMLGQEDFARLSSTTISSSSYARPLRVVNLIDFGECNVLVAPETQSASLPSAPAASAAVAAPPPARFAPPPPVLTAVGGCDYSGHSSRSKEDVLVEEIRYLRQMLSDAVEEKRIQLAMARDEVSELRQQLTDPPSGARVECADTGKVQAKTEAAAPATVVEGADLSTSPAPAAAAAAAAAAAQAAAQRRAAELEQRETELRSWGFELDRGAAALREREAELARRENVVERRLQDAREAGKVAEALSVRLTAQGMRLAQRETELCRARGRLDRFEATNEVLAEVRTVAELVAWERELREAFNGALERLEDRRVEIRASELRLSATDAGLCKICYDRPVACALLPCRHHAFCVPCGERVTTHLDPSCPLCRRHVSGIFETFSG